MKKLFAIILMALAINGIAQGSHFDFYITNSTGYEIYYRITDADLHQVVVTYPCQNGDNYWWGYDKPEGKLILMDTVTYNSTVYTLVGIDDHAFCGCSGLRGTFEFPESIQTIGAGAFKGCSNLSGNLVLPAVTTRIEDEAFSGCSSFTGKLALPDSIQYVGNQAFLNCSGFRGMLMLPASLSFIGEQAFKGVTSINSISIKAKNVPTTADNAFDEIPTWITVNVPYDMKEAYQDALGWSRFAGNTVEKSIWTGNAEPWTKGNGTTDDPYLIESAENLAWLAKSVNERLDLEIDTGWSMGGASWPVYTFHDMNIYQDTCFRMVIDIDLNKGSIAWASIGNTHTIDENVYNDGEIIAPHYQNHQGYYYTYFCGQFDGNNHVISKAHYYSSKENIGLFGIIDNAIVSNLTIDDLLAHPYYGYTIGGLAARANNSILYNCHTRGVIYNSDTGGGIVGISNKCRIERCSAQIDFTGSCVGGIAGIFVCDSTRTYSDGVFHCSYVGNINSAPLVGGIVGLCRSVSEGTGNFRVENCFSRGTITKDYESDPGPTYGGQSINTTDNKLGGIVGEVESIDTLFILNCYSNDTITSIPAHYGNAKYYAGGILATADVTTSLYIKNCYHAGPISSRNKGGILAQNTNMTIVRNCFFDGAVAPDDGFGLPLESDYMKTEAFVQQLNNGSSVFKMDTEPYANDGYPVFGTDGLIFVGAEWYYQIQNEDGNITYQHLQCTGDTTIQGKRPKIIIRSNTHYDSKNQHTTVTREYVYEENGKVYWWNGTLRKFTVLYDFSAEVGDKWTIEVGDVNFTTHVYEADLEYINGIPYKKLTIADPDNLFSGNLLSTIGHTTSFFPEQLMNHSKGYRMEGLRCYWIDGDLILKTTNDDCDAIYAELHNGIEEDDPSSGSGTFTVYPNPTNGFLTVSVQLPQYDRPTTGQTEYQISNLMGQTLLQGHISAETQQIDISTLPAGMYFISVGEQTAKFVVK